MSERQEASLSRRRMISLRVIYTDDTYLVKSVKTFFKYLTCPEEFRGSRFIELEATNDQLPWLAASQLLHQLPRFRPLLHRTRREGKGNKQVIQSILRRKVARSVLSNAGGSATSCLTENWTLTVAGDRCKLLLHYN